jgi:hypothetical protein
MGHQAETTRREVLDILRELRGLLGRERRSDGRAVDRVEAGSEGNGAGPAAARSSRSLRSTWGRNRTRSVLSHAPRITATGRGCRRATQCVPWRMDSSRRTFASGALSTFALLALMTRVASGCGPDTGCPPPGSPIGSPVQVCFDPHEVTPACMEASSSAACPSADLAAACIAHLSPSPPFEAEAGGSFQVESGPVNTAGQCCYIVQPLAHGCG